jgi:hypothetical protein
MSYRELDLPNAARVYIILSNWLWKCYNCLFMNTAGVEPSPLLLRLFVGLLYQPRMTYRSDGGAIGAMNEWQGKPKYSELTYSSAALSTTHLNASSWSRTRAVAIKPATNRLSYGTTSWMVPSKGWSPWLELHRVKIPEIHNITITIWRMASSRMLRRVALVTADVSEELSASIIKMSRIGELGTTLAVTSGDG